MPSIIRIQFGGYMHPQGTTAYTLDRQTVFDQRKRPIAEQATVQISGRIHGDDPADLQAKWIDLEDAYSQVGVGVHFNINIDGASSIFGIDGGNTIGGIRVTKKPSIQDTMGNAHQKYLGFSVELQAIVPFANSLTALVSFRETLSFSGGGPRTAMIESLYGPPVKQQTRAQTIYRATQSGQAVGMFGRPAVPAPLWPAHWTGDYSANREGPEMFGNVETNHGANWSYQFEADSPFADVYNTAGTVL
jgi:hypothetical protein